MAKTKISKAIYEAVQDRVDHIKHFARFIPDEDLKEIDKRINELIQLKAERTAQQSERNRVIAELEEWLSVHEPEEMNLTSSPSGEVGRGRKEVPNV